MINGKQRHDAVDELRRAATGEYRHVDALDVIAGAVGVSISGKYMHDAEETVYGALADFIDRPTCKYVSIGNRRFGCSWCGHVVKLDYDVPVANEAHMPFNYCPNCSAEVVKCDE